MIVPVTGISHLIFSLLLFIAWFYIRGRMQKNSENAIQSVRYMHRYFLYFLIFNIFMCLPHAAVYISPELFPRAMAWGYVIANIFLILSLSYLARMATLVSTRFASLEKYITFLWIGINIIVTALHVYVVVIKHQPYLHPESNVTTFDFPAYMGAVLSMVSLAAYVPAIILFGLSAVKSRGARRKRAVLLGLGMVVIMLAGPMHALATSWQVFVLIDFFNGVSLVLLASGIAYQLVESPEPAARGSQPAVSAV